MAATAQQLSSAFIGEFRPQPDRTVSQWADSSRIIGRPSPEPGEWRTIRVPYTRQIMDDLTPRAPVDMVVLMKAAQGAGTEIALNAIGSWADDYPNGILLVTPTTKTLRKFSRTRVDRLIANCPSLTEKFSAAKSRDGSNTIEFKEFGLDHLILTGANSAAGLRSDPVPYVIGDEVDAYPIDVDGEGEPVELFWQRTAAFRNRKGYLNSTPTLESSSRIYQWFLRGDQNLLHVPCPACGHLQVLLFGPRSIFWQGPKDAPGGLKWPKGSPDLARYECERCEERWEEWQKTDVMPRCEWRPNAPENYQPQKKNKRIRSYHISALAYPYGWPGNAWANLAEDFERVRLDPIKLKTWINLKAGEPFKDASEEKASVEALMGRREHYGPAVPDGVGVLTAGVDVQQDRLEVEVAGWGRDEESWSIDYRVIPGDTARTMVWDRLKQYLGSEFLSELGITLTIRATCIDSQYNTEMVRKFCDANRALKFWAIAGKSGQDRPVWPLRMGKPRRGKRLPPLIIGVDQGKETIYQRLKILEPGPGYCHFPQDRDRTYFDGLLSEQRHPDYTGPTPKFVWKKKTPSARNEQLDCRNYAYAALQGLITFGLRLNEEVGRMRLKAAEGANEPATRAETSWSDFDAGAEDPYLN